MIANALLEQIFNSSEKVKKLMRWGGRGRDLTYKWLNPDDAGEPNCLQRTLDLIDLTYVFDPNGARLLAELPMHVYKDLLKAQAQNCPPCDSFQIAFKGMHEMSQAGEALTDCRCSVDKREKEITDVLVWCETELARLRTLKSERENHWHKNHI